MVRVAISGKLKTGKNTIANFISDFLREVKNEPVQMIAFADPLKNMVMELFPKTDPDNLWGPSQKRENFIPCHYDSDGNWLTYRRVLTDFGKLGRSYNPDIFVNAVMDSLPNSSVIITDVRFSNELNACKKNGFKLIRVYRSNITSSKDVSETSLDDTPDSMFDFTIHNNNGLEELYDQVRAIIYQITQ